MNTSIIMTIDKQELQKIIDLSHSFSEVMRKLGYENIEGNMRTLMKRIKNDNLNTIILESNRSKRNALSCSKIKNECTSNEKMFVIDSNSSRNIIRRRILRDKLIDYKCECCKNIGEWMGKSITLELEHKNGISNDNRLENLCFLCPNCHSQTDTFGGKNNTTIKNQKKCLQCDSIVGNNSKSGLCFSCAMKTKEWTKKFIVSKSELEDMIKSMPLTKIAEKFGVSDKAIKKRACKLGLRHLIKPRGYWSKNGELL